MILVLAYWLFLFSILMPSGILVKKAFKLETINIPILVLLGMLMQTTFFTVVAFFAPLGSIPLSLSILFAAVAGYYWRRDLSEVFKAHSNSLAYLPLTLKSAFLILAFVALAKSAQIPSILDNETYYIQTIKWLNEYGFVKGLGNLHLFLAQASPWHVLQAGLNFSFISERINDVNGFLFVICIWYYLQEGYKYWQTYNRFHWIGAMPLFSALLLIFTDAPSPDLPLLMVLPVIFYLLPQKQYIENYKICTLLMTFICFIKITIAPFALLLLWGYSFKKYKDVTLTTIAIAGLWMIKNIILSGYPLYPFTFISTGFDWIIPEFSIQYTHTVSNQYIYGVFSTEPLLQTKFITWILKGGIDGWFNKLIIALLLLVPFFKIVRKNKTYLLIYITAIIHFIILFFTSPQFRFFLPEILFFCALIFTDVLNLVSRKLYLYKIALATGCIAAISMVFINILPRKMQNTVKFTAINVLLPQYNSRLYNHKYIAKQAGNLNYYTPQDIRFIYVTGNGQLPCVNERYLEWSSRNLNVIPQQRGNTMKDGFYSMEIKQ